MLPVILAVVGTLSYLYLRKRARQSLPPGPNPLPIVGNIRDLPPSGAPEYQHWLKFKDAYGPISCITILGQLIILIHDRDAVHDLLSKSSMKTSGRPYMRFADLCGFASLLNLEQYNATYRQHRKLVHQQFGTKAVAARFRDTVDIESHWFLLRVLDDPAGLVQHIKTETSAIILRITYGYAITPNTPDPLVRLIEHTMDVFALATVLMSWAVDILPVLEYIPEGLPGASFKKVVREWSEQLRTTIEVPYNFVRQQMAKGTNRLSFVSSLVEQHLQNDDGVDKADKEIEDAIKKTAVVMYGGGADTSASSIHSFVLAMMLFPDVQKRAQEEIDTIIGSDRLPQPADRDRLPYVSALVKETLRWFPVAPLGVAHRTDEDIDYREFHIPKGAYLLPSVWWFLHDPQTYSDPSSFKPDRYLAPHNEPDPEDHVFGYGRRVCPGRYLADESIFITVARLLATFDIKKAVDGSGNEIEPEIHGTSGLISRLLDFPYSITPRSSKSVHLIRSVETQHPRHGDDAGLVRGVLANRS
ncbi:cytochrome P450 [Colletotrichum somersetense]|nr:cytochrome P450 [Colletotrichum somersetense]